jgi:XTP/dITP diphosphohydrolase
MGIKNQLDTLQEIVLATTNVHKVREFKSMLKPISKIDLRSLCDFPDYEPLPEMGSTFEENATAKAIHAAATLGKWVIAEDSGLVVPALGGEPGVYSARYAGPDATDAENRKKLLDSMAHLLQEDRLAYYECVIAIASPKGLEKVAKGICEGILLNTEKGGGGFGYDPLFIKHGYSKTFAELTETIKNRISHRRKALDKLLPYLESILDGCRH